MTAYSSYDGWSRHPPTNRQYKDDRNVNNVRHTVCKFSPDVDAMDFSIQRRRLGSYDVPSTSQRLLKLDDALISSRLRARLCSASRVYCGNNILSLHRNIYAKPRPKSVQYRWSPPEISLALPKIQRAKTAGLIRLNPATHRAPPNTIPSNRKTINVKHDLKQKKPEKGKEDGNKESGELKKAKEEKEVADNKRETKPEADDNQSVADSKNIEAVDTAKTGKEDDTSNREKDHIENKQQKESTVDRKKEEKKKRKKQKRQRKMREERNLPPEENDEDIREEKVLTSRGDNSDADYTSDDSND